MIKTLSKTRNIWKLPKPDKAVYDKPELTSFLIVKD